jgi:hypothetical protein
MTDAPETKWLTPNGGLPTGAPWPKSALVEYTRTDIFQARIAELETRNGKLGDAVAYATQKFTHQGAQIANLTEAVTRLRCCVSPFPSDDTERYREEYEACEMADEILKAKP